MMIQIWIWIWVTGTNGGLGVGGVREDSVAARRRPARSPCSPCLPCSTRSPDRLFLLQVGTVFAGFHNDLNFLTVHGKSRFPGLFIWLRDGKKVPVRIPEGCLLLQAGKQMEWLTGGAIRAGYHEVVCTEQTARARDEALKAGRSTWRVSSTVFSQLASDEVLRVLDEFLAEASDEERRAIRERYPAMPVGQFVEDELRCINLRA